MKGLARELDRTAAHRKFTGQQVANLLHALIGTNLSVETRLETRVGITWN